MQRFYELLSNVMLQISTYFSPLPSLPFAHHHLHLIHSR